MSEGRSSGVNIRIIEEKLSSIRELSEAGRHDTALRMLRSIDVRQSTSPICRSEYYYYFARCDYFRGDYARALSRVRAALRYARTCSSHEVYARYKLLAGAIRHALGQLDEAIEDYLDSYASSKRAGSYKSLCGVFINIGLVHMLKGELSKASDCYTKALALSISHNTGYEQSVCRLNLSRCLWLQGRHKECLDLLDEVEQMGDHSGLALRVDQIRGIVQAYVCSFRSAHVLLHRLLKFATSERSSRDVAVCLEYLGLNEYFAGNYKKAKEYYQQVLDMPEPTASAVAQTLRMLTDVHIAEGHWDLARATAAKADTAINKISERIELGALWRAYGHIHAHDGNRDEARSFFTKSIELLRQLGARYELALSHFDAGRAKVFSEAESGEHLRITRALFVEMEVPKRVAQVDAVIAEREDAHHFDHKPASKQRLTLKTPSAPTIIAASGSMKRILALADKVKDSDLTILITGETGTGKDLLAEYIHKTSNRAARPLRVVNSAAMPESLLEAELFGVTKGTYSGATTDRPGLIELTDGGTFVFDEIGEVPPAIQAKLLRLLDSKVVRRLGGSEDRRIDVRFLALTNRDLGQMVREGSFRSDLYHRLCQMPIHLPPLRERPEDIVPLAIMLLARCGIAIDREAIAAALRDPLEAYSWPGNARELIAMITRVAALLDGNGNSDVFELLRQQLGAPDAEGSERRRLFEALRRHNGNKSKVAEELGIPRTTLNSQLKKYNL